MPTLSINLLYPYLMIFTTGKKTCENMGRSIEKSGDTVSRSLPEAIESLAVAKKIAIKTFGKKKIIRILIDDSILRKMFATQMEGAWKLYDGVFGMCVTGYRLFVAMISCGDVAFPWECKINLPKELAPENAETKLQIIQRIYDDVQENFPDATITIVADGAFATIEMIAWCSEISARATMRMHKNRRVTYKGESVRICEIKKLIPKGWRLARTIEVLWHGHTVWITAEKRINKRGEATIVYLVSTYKTKPAVHAKTYKQRWPIEKFFRTDKQTFGLQDCLSTSFEKQCKHVAAALLAYSMAQLEGIASRMDSVEDAVKALRRMPYDVFIARLSALNQNLCDA